jgi:excisionase family DNA binding protein
MLSNNTINLEADKNAAPGSRLVAKKSEAALNDPALRFGSDCQLALSINAAAAALNVSRSTVYALVNAGRLPTIKIGARTLITRLCLERLLEELVAESRPLDKPHHVRGGAG